MSGDEDAAVAVAVIVSVLGAGVFICCSFVCYKVSAMGSNELEEELRRAAAVRVRQRELADEEDRRREKRRTKKKKERKQHL